VAPRCLEAIFDNLVRFSVFHGVVEIAVEIARPEPVEIFIGQIRDTDTIVAAERHPHRAASPSAGDTARDKSCIVEVGRMGVTFRGSRALSSRLEPVTFRRRFPSRNSLTTLPGRCACIL